jgi:hypothetical protein
MIKSIFVFIGRCLVSVLLFPLLILAMILFLIECPIGLLVFMFNYRSFQKSGSGAFHRIFFKTSGVYQVLHLYHRLWGKK